MAMGGTTVGRSCRAQLQRAERAAWSPLDRRRDESAPYPVAFGKAGAVVGRRFSAPNDFRWIDGAMNPRPTRVAMPTVWRDESAPYAGSNANGVAR